MPLRLSALVLGLVTGFVFAWARLTDPDSFHRMLSLRSPTIYLLMASAVCVAFVGAQLLRGRRALLTGERIDWRPSRPNRSHVLGSVLFGIGWGVSNACPGPTAAQLGAGRMLALAVATGIVVGVRLQPSIAGAIERLRPSEAELPAIGAADVLLAQTRPRAGQKLITLSAQSVQSTSSSIVERCAPSMSAVSERARASIHVAQSPILAPCLTADDRSRSRL